MTKPVKYAKNYYFSTKKEGYTQIKLVILHPQIWFELSLYVYSNVVKINIRLKFKDVYIHYEKVYLSCSCHAHAWHTDGCAC